MTVLDGAKKREQQGRWPVRPADKSPLPCRGCTRDCGMYGQCKRKPWRMGET